MRLMFGSSATAPWKRWTASVKLFQCRRRFWAVGRAAYHRRKITVSLLPFILANGAHPALTAPATSVYHLASSVWRDLVDILSI